MRKFILGNYFEESFYDLDGIITDIPYKGAITNKLNEENFDFDLFLSKTDKETKSDSFLITFCNLLCLKDLINYSEKTNWKFHTFQIWNKEPIRNWISWQYPLRTIEFIAYFKKGNFKFSFKDGTIKEAYKRNQFGGKLKETTKNKNKVSYGMYSEILNIKLESKKDRIHPTQKPKWFSEMFSKIVPSESFVLDPFCGSGNLLNCFIDSIGVDIIKYRIE